MQLYLVMVAFFLPFLFLLCILYATFENARITPPRSKILLISVTFIHLISDIIFVSSLNVCRRFLWILFEGIIINISLSLGKKTTTICFDKYIELCKISTSTMWVYCKGRHAPISARHRIKNKKAVGGGGGGR